MLKRAQSLHQKAKEGDDARSSAPAAVRPQLDLRASPFMRWAAARVGRGGEASIMKEVAEAAMQEAEMSGHDAKRCFSVSRWASIFLPVHLRLG